MIGELEHMKCSSTLSGWSLATCVCCPKLCSGSRRQIQHKYSKVSLQALLRGQYPAGLWWYLALWHPAESSYCRFHKIGISQSANKDWVFWMLLTWLQPRWPWQSLPLQPSWHQLCVPPWNYRLEDPAMFPLCVREMPWTSRHSH